MLQIGQKIHSHTVLAIANISDMPVILVESDTQYVIARIDPKNDEEWYWGQYIMKYPYSEKSDKLRAWEKFIERIQRVISDI